VGKANPKAQRGKEEVTKNQACKSKLTACSLRDLDVSFVTFVFASSGSSNFDHAFSFMLGSTLRDLTREGEE